MPAHLLSLINRTNHDTTRSRHGITNHERITTGSSSRRRIRHIALTQDCSAYVGRSRNRRMRDLQCEHRRHHMVAIIPNALPPGPTWSARYCEASHHASMPRDVATDQ